MKVRITSRSGEEDQASFEAPETLLAFLEWLATQGTITVNPPGQTVQDSSWGTNAPDPDLWTIHLIDEYD